MAAQTPNVKTTSGRQEKLAVRILIYALLILIAGLMLVPFIWMISASFKLNKDVFTFPIEWIPSNPRPQNYVDIWTPSAVCWPITWSVCRRIWCPTGI